MKCIPDSALDEVSACWQGETAIIVVTFIAPWLAARVSAQRNLHRGTTVKRETQFLAGTIGFRDRVWFAKSSGQEKKKQLHILHLRPVCVHGQTSVVVVSVWTALIVHVQRSCMFGSERYPVPLSWRFLCALRWLLETSAKSVKKRERAM